MKQKLLIAFLFLISIQAFAQDQKWSVEASYPVIGDSNYLYEYEGVIDLGVAYRFQKLGIFQVGLGLNASLLENSATSLQRVNTENRILFIQPRLFTELLLKKFRPSFGIGYSLIKEHIDEEFGNGNSFDYEDLRGGLNLNLCITYDLTKSFYLKAQYDLTDVVINDKFQFETTTISNKSKEYISQYKFGLGFRF